MICSSPFAERANSRLSLRQGPLPYLLSQAGQNPFADGNNLDVGDITDDVKIHFSAFAILTGEFDRHRAFGSMGALNPRPLAG